MSDKDIYVKPLREVYPSISPEIVEVLLHQFARSLDTFLRLPSECERSQSIPTLILLLEEALHRESAAATKLTDREQAILYHLYGRLYHEFGSYRKLRRKG